MNIAVSLSRALLSSTIIVPAGARVRPTRRRETSTCSQLRAFGAAYMFASSPEGAREGGGSPGMPCIRARIGESGKMGKGATLARERLQNYKQRLSVTTPPRNDNIVSVLTLL